MSNLLLRTLTALVGVPVVVGLVYVGGWPFIVIVALAALAAQYELYGLVEQAGLAPLKWLGLLLGLFISLRVVFEWSIPALLLATLLLIAAIPFRSDDRPLANVGATILGAIYPTAFLAFLIDLRESTGPVASDGEAFALTLSVFVLIWASDTFAYLVGRQTGSHPLAPRISPKKTWEGAVGGALGAMFVAVLLRVTILDFLAWTHVLVIAFICGVLGQIGDLAESRMKREVGAKESGNLLPGHGGVLDRVDALLLATPLVYLYLSVVGVVE